MAWAPRPDRCVKRGLIVSAALLAAVAAAVVTHTDQTRAVWRSLASVPITALASALVLVLCQLGLQAVRLWAILPQGVELTLGRVAYAFTMGEWVNTFAPVRAGDALKVVLLNRAAGTHAVSLGKATGAVLADKMVDAGSLVLLCATAGLTSLSGAEVRARLPGPAIALGAATGVALLWLGLRSARPAWLERLRGLQRELGRGLSALRDPAKLLTSTSFSVGAWLAEVLALRVLCRALGAPASYSLIVLALAVLNLGISVPVAVANIGVYEAALALGLQHAGAPLTSAVAIATLHHALELLGTNVGAAALSLSVPSGNRLHIWYRRFDTLS